MAHFDEGEYFIEPQEEVVTRVGDTEIRRIHSEAVGGEEVEQQKPSSEQTLPEKKRTRPQWMTNILGFVTGDILLAKEADRVYKLFIMLGVLFMISIGIIFTSLHRDLQCSALKKEVAMLKEKAIRYSEKCYQQTSHSAILQLVKSRGLELEEPKTQPTILR